MELTIVTATDSFFLRWLSESWRGYSTRVKNEERILILKPQEMLYIGDIKKCEKV